MGDENPSVAASLGLLPNGLLTTALYSPVFALLTLAIVRVVPVAFGSLFPFRNH